MTHTAHLLSEHFVSFHKEPTLSLEEQIMIWEPNLNFLSLIAITSSSRELLMLLGRKIISARFKVSIISHTF